MLTLERPIHSSPSPLEQIDELLARRPDVFGRFEETEAVYRSRGEAYTGVFDGIYQAWEVAAWCGPPVEP